MAAKTFKKLCGWAGHENPWLVREQFRLLSDSGMFGHKLKARKARPEYFSLHRVARKVIGKDVGGGIQEIGDCFPAGTMVRMADGTEKPIEQVKIGELVLTHKNQVKPVTDTIIKSYKGSVVTLSSLGNNRSVTATPDHRFVWSNASGNMDWKSIGNMQVGDVVYFLHDGKGVFVWSGISNVSGQDFVGDVYCLEVEGDHSFVANGYAVHNCVSWGAKHAVEYLQCCDILIRGESEKFRPVFSPYYYGTGRVYVGKGQMGNQDGSLGSWMAAAVKKYGTLWANESGVPPYSGAVAKAYGDPRPENDLDKWLNTAKPFLVKDTVNISTFDQLCDEIASGRAVTIASGVGFRMTPGRDGYHEMSGSWPHQMCIYGYGPDYALICNSWGDVHGKLKDFHENDDLPIGTIRARKKAVERIISEGETFSFTNVEGFPEQDLDKALFDLIGKD